MFIFPVAGFVNNVHLDTCVLQSNTFKKKAHKFSQVVEFLGEALARMLATQTMEEHGVLQYVAALKFVNQTVESRWVSFTSSPCNVSDSSKLNWVNP